MAEAETTIKLHLPRLVLCVDGERVSKLKLASDGEIVAVVQTFNSKLGKWVNSEFSFDSVEVQEVK